MFAVLPLMLHVTEYVLPAVQFSPPLGAVTVTVGLTTGGLMVKLLSLVSAARMFVLTSSARIRMRHELELVPLGIIQLNERAPGVWALLMFLYVLLPMLESATN